MKIFVTGSSGFIGQQVCKELTAHGHEVQGYDLRSAPGDGCSTVVGNILDLACFKEAVAGFAPEAIIHLAARCDLDGKTLQDYDANITGVKNLCTIAQECDSVRRVICTSSQLVCKPGYIPANELDFKPHTIYGESKVETEKMIRGMPMKGVEWCIGRPTTVWGPGMSDHYQKLLYAIKSRKFFHAGSSKLYKSYSYIGNIAFQYRKLVEAEATNIQGKVFYLADYEPLSLREYINGMQERLGAPKVPEFPLPIAKALAISGDLLCHTIWKSCPFNSFRLNNILTEYVFDLSATERVCGKLPYSIEKGLDATADWFLSKEQAQQPHA